jgi:hypothetical protein
MQKDLRKTSDGCALLKYLHGKLRTTPGASFTRAFCDEHIPDFSRKWQQAGLDDVLLGSLHPATLYRHTKPLFARKSTNREADWAGVFRRAKQKLLPAEHFELGRCPLDMTLLRFIVGSATNQLQLVERSVVGKLEKEKEKYKKALDHVL